MTAKFDIEQAINYMQKYINTYRNQACYKDYGESIWIEDILYGLGVSTNSDFKFADGFEQFKKKLKDEGYVNE